MRHTKKLIEVALPLDAINEASAREKSIRHGHPSTLHLWWARRPLAAARAVIFAQMVDDPSEYVDVLLSDPKKKRAAARELRARLAEREAQHAGEYGDDASPVPTLADVIAEHERDRLFDLIKVLVKWENTTNETVLQQARDEIWQSWRRTCAKNADHPRAAELFNRHKLPAFHDPFAGGGSLPLEAQRLGIEPLASDLNPVAVLINKAMIEIPPKFKNNLPISHYTEHSNEIEMEWKNTQGLAEDVRYYGKWVGEEARKRIGHLYPRIQITASIANECEELRPHIGSALTVNAWIWARTVKSPNPAYSDVSVPLTSTFMLSNKKGKEAYVQPRIGNSDYTFTVKYGKPIDPKGTSSGTKIARGSNFKCLMSGTLISGDYIKSEGKNGRMGVRLMAIIAESKRGRVYLSPDNFHEEIAYSNCPKWKPEGSVPEQLTGGTCFGYGLTQLSDLFTSRQLIALVTFSDLVTEVRDKIEWDARQAGWEDDGAPLRSDGTGATAIAEAVTTYLGLGIGRAADYWNSNAIWSPSGFVAHLFSRQAIPMVWDYVESNPFSSSSGNWIDTAIGWIPRVIEALPKSPIDGVTTMRDATLDANVDSNNQLIFSTDPPYFDNISYADISDFFYVWLRRTLGDIFPELFQTLLTPKFGELVAAYQRHKTKQDAATFFLDGMTQALSKLCTQSHRAIPVTVYYAFKQTESKADDGVVSTGWEKFLDAVIRAGLEVRGTWPIRTERSTRPVALGSNALASSIVLVCRPRSKDASSTTLRSFITALKSDIPRALKEMQRSGIAPVDLAQAAIGPGMASYTRYTRVLNAAGQPILVRDALALINQTLDEVLTEHASDLDANSQWALAWFEQHGFDGGDYGIAETLSTAKNASVTGLVDAGILKSDAGRVRLLRPEELSKEWDPESTVVTTSWGILHHLIRVLQSEGEDAAGSMLERLGERTETSRELCYRLYSICERKKRFSEAASYNALVKSWPEIVLRAHARSSDQSEMF